MKQYPIIDGHRRHYVRTPIIVTKKVAGKLLTKVPIGSYIAVDVLDSGFAYLMAPAAFATEELCQKSCDIHNSYHGFSKEDAFERISISMGHTIVITMTLEDIKNQES